MRWAEAGHALHEFHGVSVAPFLVWIQIELVTLESWLRITPVLVAMVTGRHPGDMEEEPAFYKAHLLAPLEAGVLCASPLKVTDEGEKGGFAVSHFILTTFFKSRFVVDS